MRTLLTSTALVALFSMGAVAQEATTTVNSNLLTEGYQVVDTDGLTSKLMGFPVYTSATNDADQIGEINDIVIGQDGKVAAVILGVGGFLGIGEKNVAVDYGQLQWVVAEDDTERLVLDISREALETAAAVEMVDDEPADTAAVAPADNNAMVVDDSADMAAAPAVDQPVDTVETGAVTTDPNATAADPATVRLDPLNRDGLVDFDETTLTAEELTGVNVYGPTDEHIGVIGDFVLGEDGNVDAVIIDFGGFLGIGTKQVAVGYEDLQFYTNASDNRLLVLNVTREQMEAAPDFNSDTYAAERDSQRLVVSPMAATAG
jgi:sporulation protein YlmC with PRC-barrel domain